MAIVTIGNIPVYDAILTDAETGMLKISLVDDPAVMSDFLAFDSTKKMLMYSVADEEKRIVRGVVMRADFPIYRRDARNGEFYIIYKANTIREMAEKYLAEARQNNVNLMHEEGSDVEGVQMVQYFIKDTANGVNPAGFEDIADGSLFAEFHILNDAVWASIKEGTYKGFSLEGIFDLEPETDKEGIADIVDVLNGAFSKLFKNKKMSKLSRLKSALAKAIAEFGNITTDKGILAWDGEADLAVGDAVFVENEDGTRATAEDGEYLNADENQVIVVVDGKVTEFKDAVVEAPTPEDPAETPAPEAEEETPAEPELAKIATDKGELLCEGELAVGIAVYVASEEGNIPAEDGEYLTEDGKTLKVESGVIAEIVDAPAEEAEPEAPAEDVEALKAENASLKAEVETLKAQIETLSRMPSASPAHEEVETSAKMEKTGIRGLDNLARIARAK